jgi:hypothetical protein
VHLRGATLYLFMCFLLTCLAMQARPRLESHKNELCSVDITIFRAHLRTSAVLANIVFFLDFMQRSLAFLQSFKLPCWYQVATDRSSRMANSVVYTLVRCHKTTLSYFIKTKSIATSESWNSRRSRSASLQLRLELPSTATSSLQWSFPEGCVRSHRPGRDILPLKLQVVLVTAVVLVYPST